jgi:hypothetical protein
MPQSSSELRAKWETDVKAEACLLKFGNFTIRRGLILAKDGYKPTDTEWSAIQYLIEEWDYDYGGML